MVKLALACERNAGIDFSELSYGHNKGVSLMSTMESGLHGHSSAIASENYVIFTLDDESPYGLAAFKHWAVANGIHFKPLLGMWQGKAEHPFLVNSRNMLAIFTSGLVNRQECILQLGACDRADRRKATLVWINENIDTPDTDLGRFGEVSESEAKAETVQSWSYDPSTKTYFMAKQVWQDAPTMHLGDSDTRCPACGYDPVRDYPRQAWERRDNAIVRKEAKLPGAVNALLS